MNATRRSTLASWAARAATLGLCVLAASCAPGPDRLIGETCTNNGDCRDLCATGNDFPGGFCTTNCFDDGDCPPDAICADVDGGRCLFPCAGEDVDYCADLLQDARYECRDRDTPDGRVVLVCMGN